MSDDLDAKLAAAAQLKAEAAREPDPPIEEPEEDGPLQLSESELARIRAEAAKQVAKELAKRNAERMQELMKKTLDEEILAQRRAAGLTNHHDDIIEVLIDVAPFDNQIVIDGTVYQHGGWYKMDRRRWESVREIMARGWDAEDRSGNPNKKFYRTVAGTMNPMMHEIRMDDGTFTIGLQTKINGMTGAVTGAPRGA
jgi:monoamine oxidase